MRAFSVAVWAEAGMEAAESQVLPDLADDSWLQGLSVFVAGSRTLQSSAQVQLPYAGISQQRVVHSFQNLMEELVFC